MSFAFLGIMLATPPSIKDSDCEWRWRIGRVFWFERPLLDPARQEQVWVVRGSTPARPMKARQDFLKGTKLPILLKTNGRCGRNRGTKLPFGHYDEDENFWPNNRLASGRPWRPLPLARGRRTLGTPPEMRPAS
jgi:hypothetical protein